MFHRRWQLSGIVVVVALASACGGSSSAPTPLPTPEPPLEAIASALDRTPDQLTCTDMASGDLAGGKPVDIAAHPLDLLYFREVSNPNGQKPTNVALQKTFVSNDDTTYRWNATSFVGSEFVLCDHRTPVLIHQCSYFGPDEISEIPLYRNDYSLILIESRSGVVVAEKPVRGRDGTCPERTLADNYQLTEAKIYSVNDMREWLDEAITARYGD